METPVFKLPRVGLVGGRPVDRTWMEAIEARARRLEAACRYVPEETGEVDDRQLLLPFPNISQKSCVRKS